MRPIFRCLPLLALAPLCVSLASAQSAVDFNIGFGGAWDSAAKTGIDSNTGLTCTPTTTSSTCQASPKLSAFMLGFGGDVMVKPKVGFGVDFDVQPNRPNYGPLQSRQSFYDIDAVFRPVQTKRAFLDLRGGIGGARTSFSYTQTGCVGPACTTQTSPVGSVNHFQAHIGVGVEIMLTDHFFVRPQFDMHFVNGGTDVWGSNFMPAAMVFVGYNLGSK